MVVLVTGASSGIGKAIAIHLHNKGHQVFGTSRKADNGDLYNGFSMVKLDVTDDLSVKQGIEYILDQAGKIDVLVNNAGIGMVGSVEDSSIEELKQHFETNFYGPMRLMHAVLPGMRQQLSGKIINITSLAGIFGLPYRGAYCASKGALKLLSESMRMELLKFNVFITALAPGDFKTNVEASRIMAKKIQDSVYKEEFERAFHIMNEEVNTSGDPRKVARAVEKIVNCKSPKAHYIVSSLLQRIVVHLRYWLPTNFFYRLIMNNYKMKN